ncbi:MAG: hypothetical protein ACPGVU_08170 [Limisphaerales bacterium]
MALGLLVYAIGVFGTWLQGEFWWVTFGKFSDADRSTLSDTRMAMCLPELFVLVSGLIMSSSFFVFVEGKKHKDLLILSFIALLALPVWITGSIAGSNLFSKSQAALQEHFENAKSKAESRTQN